MLPDQRPIIYRLVRLIYKLARPLLSWLKKLHDKYKQLLPDGAYHDWAVANNNFCLVEDNQVIKYEPLISIIVPVYNPAHTHLLEMAYSVINQHYENWELILVNASTDKKSQQQVNNLKDIDRKVKIVEVANNEGISANTNIGIKHATGEYLTFLDHDDTLHPCALHSMVEAMQDPKPAELLYSDEDKINSDSSRYFKPLFKPNWSPDLLRNVNYINHLTVIKADMVNAVKGLRSSCDGAQDYDLLLRVIDKHQPKIMHVPRVLYHWRATSGSTAQDINTKKYVLKAGSKALNAHIKRSGINARGRAITGKPGFYEVTYKPVDFSIIVGKVSATRQLAAAKWLKKLIAEAKTPEVNVELIVGSWFKKFSPEQPDIPIKYVADAPAEYWKRAIKRVSYPVCVCFKTAATPKTKNGLANLAASAADPGHTAVTPILTNKSKVILDAGLIGSQLPKRLFEGYKLGTSTYFGDTDWSRNVDDLTTGVLAVDTERFKEMIKFGAQTYHNAETLLSMLSVSYGDGSKFLTWPHTPFEYNGLLKPINESPYYNTQLLKFTPRGTMHIDNWGKTSTHEPEA